jgi:hypothetical protein
MSVKKLKLSDIDALVESEINKRISSGNMNEQFVTNLLNRMKGPDKWDMSSVRSDRRNVPRDGDIEAEKGQREKDLTDKTAKEIGLSGQSANAYDSAVAQAALMDKNIKNTVTTKSQTEMDKMMSWVQGEIEGYLADERSKTKSEMQTITSKILAFVEQEMDAYEAGVVDKLLADPQFMDKLIPIIYKKMFPGKSAPK